MGAAGDMLTAALLELLPDPDAFVKEFNLLGIPGVTMVRERSVKCGITGTHVRILVDGQEEGVPSDSIMHHHTGLADLRRIVTGLNLEENVRKNIQSVYSEIAQAESAAHGMPVDQIHFHEVGTMDALADVTAVCMLMDKIHPDKVIATPVCTGFGTVKCAHGILPVPAPATALILKDIPVYGGEIQGELCTPTGAALLKYFVSEYSQMPVMRVQKIGCGMGMKEFPRANCVRAFLGTDDVQITSVTEG